MPCSLPELGRWGRSEVAMFRRRAPLFYLEAARQRLGLRACGPRRALEVLIQARYIYVSTPADAGRAPPRAFASLF